MISANGENGIELSGTHVAGVLMQYNNIGVGQDGATALGNSGNGILITGGANANYVGNSIIANNTQRGIYVDSTGGANNKFSENSIYSNGGLGIDLRTIGPSPTNDLQDSPTIIYAEQIGSTDEAYIEVEIQGTSSETFTVELFTSDSPDSSGYGEGKTFLTSGIITTDGSGFGLLRSIPAVSIGKYISATVTENLTTYTGSTSEFSNALVVSAASAPAAPTGLDLIAADDAGARDYDTNIVKPRISGTAEANATIKIYDGTALVGTGMADASGNWTIRLSTALTTNGSHSLTATATDLAENTSVASSVLTISIHALGDVNQDSHVNVSDVSALTTALSNFTAYESTYSLTPEQMRLICDVNEDGSVTNFDIFALELFLANGEGY